MKRRMYSKFLIRALPTAAVACCLGAQQNLPTEANNSAGEEFDQSLQLVLRSSRENFRTVEGARIENRRRDFFFEARTYLPTANYCRIFFEGTPVYCCEWTVKDKAPSALLFEKLLAKIEGALRAEWVKKERSTSHRKDVVFSAQQKPVVHIMRPPDMRHIYILVLPPGSSTEGYLGIIPSTEDFVHQ